MVFQPLSFEIFEENCPTKDFLIINNDKGNIWWFYRRRSASPASCASKNLDIRMLFLQDLRTVVYEG